MVSQVLASKPKSYRLDARHQSQAGSDKHAGQGALLGPFDDGGRMQERRLEQTLPHGEVLPF
jgi:hypothetical protein